jgi:hypothetical protein
MLQRSSISKFELKGHMQQPSLVELKLSGRLMWCWWKWWLRSAVCLVPVWSLCRRAYGTAVRTAWVNTARDVGALFIGLQCHTCQLEAISWGFRHFHCFFAQPAL